ncbi:GNAT family N-acetyltransferase [Kordiimonas sp. SCSIO 12610]|uniref:GNAT family N-acetyltransferase n=1 Tax=Kordiimonas sp. SCSIO 12610 TaxID=2829597 RepID=UPI00210E81BD|nr:GNAT family N-acetyltransferase [Kordiimonas sp. SCSIO 12610]UTW54586.1 GNAT family N-acetyltransferase [Kordiimonas sp. SCSIO 12610]
MMNSFEYRDINRADIDIVLGLIKELATHEGRPEAVTITPERLTDLLFGGNPVAHGIVGLVDGQIVGYALSAVKFSSFKGHKIAYIEDILVSQNARGNGLGIKMMRATVEKALSIGCEALEWSALDDNEVAIGFYDHIDADRETGRIHFEFDFQSMQGFVGKDYD